VLETCVERGSSVEDGAMGPGGVVARSVEDGAMGPGDVVRAAPIWT
jgi:hypothetical protein